MVCLKFVDRVCSLLVIRIVGWGCCCVLMLFVDVYCVESCLCLFVCVVVL